VWSSCNILITNLLLLNKYWGHELDNSFFFFFFPEIPDVNCVQLVAFIWFPCRLPCDKMWCAYDVAVCVLYYHNVSFIYAKRDTDPDAEVYRFDNLFFFFSFFFVITYLTRGFQLFPLPFRFLDGRIQWVHGLRWQIIRVPQSSCLCPPLKFPFCQFIAVQLQHHARHRLPTFQLIFVHVIESLVFVPVSIDSTKPFSNFYKLFRLSSST